MSKMKLYVITSNFPFQDPLCTPLGLECYQNVNIDGKKCLMQCKGIYADVDRKQVDQIENMEEMVARYEEYRRGFQEDIEIYYRDIKIKGMCF